MRNPSQSNTRNQQIRSFPSRRRVSAMRQLRYVVYGLKGIDHWLSKCLGKALVEADGRKQEKLYQPGEDRAIASFILSPQILIISEDVPVLQKPLMDVVVVEYVRGRMFRSPRERQPLEAVVQAGLRIAWARYWYGVDQMSTGEYEDEHTNAIQEYLVAQREISGNADYLSIERRLSHLS